MRTTKLVTTAALAGCVVLAAAGCTSSTGGRAGWTAPQSEGIEQPSPGSEAWKEEPQSDATGEQHYVNAEQWWETMDPAARVASVLMLHYPGTNTQGFTNFVSEFQPAGLILMGDNIPEPESDLATEVPVWAEQGELPLLVAIDQEGGVVSRLDGDPGRSAVELRDGDPAVTEEAYSARADFLRGLGINVNFGIVADTTDDQDSFIWSRILGSTPEEAAAQVSAAVSGERGKVLSTLKHFPGHGTVSADSHDSIPSSQLSEPRWLSSAAVPFEAGIEAGADMVMMGHLVFPKIAAEPASISPTWHQILRDELGFEGIIVSDDLKMLRDSGDPELEDPVTNAIEAINSGSTLILDVGGDSEAEVEEFAHDLINGLVTALEDGSLDEDILRAAGTKVLEARAALRESIP